jgi:hypothetical protein
MRKYGSFKKLLLFTTTGINIPQSVLTRRMTGRFRDKSVELEQKLHIEHEENMPVLTPRHIKKLLVQPSRCPQTLTMLVVEPQPILKYDVENYRYNTIIGRSGWCLDTTLPSSGNHIRFMVPALGLRAFYNLSTRQGYCYPKKVQPILNEPIAPRSFNLKTVMSYHGPPNGFDDKGMNYRNEDFRFDIFLTKEKYIPQEYRWAWYDQEETVYPRRIDLYECNAHDLLSCWENIKTSKKLGSKLQNFFNALRNEQCPRVIGTITPTECDPQPCGPI